MNTTADKLELLLRTKERQKAYLQEKYPLLDFDTIPFRSYLDLFQGRSYVPGFVGGWKAYGRSNDEDAEKRKYLYDYSGNGRDIELFNFAFAGMSGYGGYPQDMSHFSKPNTGVNVETTGTSITITTLVEGVGKSAFMSVSYYSKRAMKLKVTSSIALTASRIIVYNKTGWTIAYSQNLTVNGVTDVNVIPDEYLTDEYEGNIYLAFSGDNSPVGSTVTVELLPDYPGALVSDGVDDYGQCVKDFALPDDYTVVAIRKITNGNGAGFASKGGTSGAFIFDATSDKVGLNAWSYGKATYISPMPALFSYQTKTSYNGKTITPGTAEDTEADPFYIFTHVKNGYSQAALFDVRIYDHSLTAEELQQVKDEMMADYENATGGGIADITYVADWDAKGRSNDEEEPMRSQWTDKATGKVINLSNYSFSQMSGWNGYNYDFSSNWMSDQASMLSFEKTQGKTIITGFKEYADAGFNFYINSSNPAMHVRLLISGLNGKNSCSIQYKANLDDTYTTLKTIREDGILEVDVPESAITVLYFHIYDKENPDAITIEQLPLYPGALVSDGVDDKIQAEEALGEVGSVLIN